MECLLCLKLYEMNPIHFSDTVPPPLSLRTVPPASSFFVRVNAAQQAKLPAHTLWVGTAVRACLLPLV